MNSVIAKLAECIFACNECHDACLHEKMAGMMAECIRLDKDCAVICAATLQLVHHGSRMKPGMLKLCIESCEKCAAECSRHNDDHCRACAAACRACAAACRDFLKSLN